MIKRRRTLIVLSAVLLVLVAACVTLYTVTKNSGGAGELVAIPTAAAGDITALSWSADGGETLTIRNENGVWVTPADATFPVDADSETLRGMIDGISGMTAKSEITNPDSDAVYGLDNPRCRITVSTAVGDITYTVGGVVSVGAKPIYDSYYVRCSGADSVFVVDSRAFAHFGADIYALVRQEAIPELSALRGFVAEGRGTRTEFNYIADSGAISYTDRYLWYAPTENGGYNPLSAEAVQKFNNNILGLAWVRCIAHNATNTELAQYGLTDDAAVRITVQYLVREMTDTGATDAAGKPVYENTERIETFAVLLGGYVDQYCYARLPGSAMVYLIDVERADALMHADIESLRATDLCLMNWATVGAADITVDGTAYRMDRDGAGVFTSGAALEPAAVDEFLNTIYRIKAAEILTGFVPSGDPKLTLTFHRNTPAFSTVTIEFHQYNGSLYAVTFNGETRLAVKREQVEQLCVLAENLFPGS